MYEPTINSRLVAKKVIYLPTCHSTNDIAAELVHKGLVAEGTIVITDRQTRGRGQRNTRWDSEPGKNLTFSLYLKPTEIAVKSQFLITVAIALGVHAYTDSRLPGSSIKWPNDILANRKKIAGILIENTLVGSSIRHCIIGIGFNLNQSLFSTPHATSLSAEIGHEVLLGEEFQELTASLDKYWALFKNTSQESLLSLYTSQLAGLGARRNFNTPQGSFAGSIVGVEPNGKLKVQTDKGDLKQYNSKEIEWDWTA